jgi:hypothetical protein
MADLASRVRDIIRGGQTARRELTYEPESPAHPGDRGPRREHEASVDLDRLACALCAVPDETSGGRCLRIDRRYEADRWHGDLQIGQCELRDLAPLQILDPGFVADRGQLAHRFGGAEPRAVFLDIETTGLSGGAGTVAFLVGCGWFDLGAFQMRQFLLPAYAAERALLAAVAASVAPADLIVTFNGKTFDLPLMETRWLFHRMAMPLADKPHFDMLHPARRLWRRREDEAGCSLTSLECDLFGVRRRGDVPGFEIPSRYFRFLRTGDPSPLEAVLEHNRLDLVSLAAITARAAALAARGVAACRDGRERLALGRVLERAMRGAEADACYTQAAEDADPGVRAEAFCRLALRHRRARRHGEAAEAWQQILLLGDHAAALKGCATVARLAREALAVHKEHRVRDLDGARALARAALAMRQSPRQREALQHRLGRLERKMEARSQGAARSCSDPWPLTPGL